jgi:hypothetical protein
LLLGMQLACHMLGNLAISGRLETRSNPLAT